MPSPWLSERTRATTLAAQILLGLALTGIGILLTGFAVNSISLGRPITQAWIVAVLGLVLILSGALVTGSALISAFLAKKAVD